MKNYLSFLTFFLAFFIAYGQKTTGIVQNQLGEPLANVVIYQKDDKSLTTSDTQGSFSIEASAGATLVFSHLGYFTKEIIAGEEQLEVKLEEDIALLSDVVITATRVPIRRIESPSAINVLTKGALQTKNSESFSEALPGLPGVFATNLTGRKGGVAYTRGFPDDGNMVYTGFMLDGLPFLASSSTPPNFFIQTDINTERIEYVRGSSATLFGRSSSAGVINVISRTGGDKMGGTVRLTQFNENTDSDGLNAKLEANLNGPISEQLRYNVGGFYVSDNGYKDIGHRDKGGQFRGNLDYLLPKNKGNIRLYGGYVHTNFQFVIDAPYRLSDLKLKDDWETADTYHSQAINAISNVPVIDFATFTPYLDNDDNPILINVGETEKQGNETKGAFGGTAIDYNLGNDFTIVYKNRVQQYDYTGQGNVGIGAFYTDDINSNFRAHINNNGEHKEFMNELRLEYKMELGSITHSFSLGGYYAHGKYREKEFLLTHVANADIENLTVQPDPRFGDWIGIYNRNGDYKINTLSFFGSDEIKLNEKMTLNVGLRYDQIKMDLKGFLVTGTMLKRDIKHSDFSASAGFNYLMDDRSSFYISAIRAFRMPDYELYTPLSLDISGNFENTPNKIEDNEIVYNTELGYRLGLKDVAIDVSIFNSFINNRLTSVYEEGQLTSKPIGDNQIMGSEINLTYAPSVAKGLSLNTNLTYQNSKIKSFKIPLVSADPDEDRLYGNELVNEGNDHEGNPVYLIEVSDNRLPEVPLWIWNVSANYNHKYFGINATVNYNTGIYSDATNIYESNNIWKVDLGAHLKYNLSKGEEIRLGFQVKNLLDVDKAYKGLGMTTSDAAIAMQQAIDANSLDTKSIYITGVPLFLPRRFLTTLTYTF